MNYKIVLLLCSVIHLSVSGCALRFEVTSQRTALENQILGAYQEIDQDLVAMASVRAVGEDGEHKEVPDLSDLQQRAVEARQNQQFNLDDIEELKASQLIGEANNGLMKILPSGIGNVNQAIESDLRLARMIIAEENRDRRIIWHRVLQQSPDLEEDDLHVVISNHVIRGRESAQIGHWLQNDDGTWFRKR